MPNNILPGIDDAVASVMQQDTDSTATAIRNNVQNSVGKNPDQAARYQHLARFIGVPVETVEQDPDEVEQQAAVQRVGANTLAKNTPKTAAYLAAPNNMAKSHDDIPNLAGLESVVKTVPNPFGASAPPTFGDESIGGAVLSGLGLSFNRGATAVNILGGAVPTIYDRVASLMTGKPTTAAQDAYFRTFVDPLLAARPALEVNPNAPFVNKAASTVGNLIGMLSQITLTGSGGAPAELATGSSTAQVLGAQAAHGVKAMAFPAISDATDTARRVYQETGDAGAAARAAQMQYATSSAAGVVPLSAPGGLLTRLAGGAVSGVASGEVSRQAMNMVLPTSMQSTFNPEDLALSAISGAMLGGVMGPRAHTTELAGVRATYTEAAKAEQAEQAGEQLQTMSQMAAESKTRGRDAEGFRQLVQSMTEDGNLQDVYVDANIFADALEKGGSSIQELARTLPDVAEQFAQAAQTNGDIRIPVADYATNIAGGPVDALLLPHLRVDPDGMSYQQSQEYFANQKTQLTEQAQKLAAEKQEQDAREADLQGVHDKVLEQLEQAGRFPAAVNKSYAALVRAFYDTTAQRAGMLPSELYERFPLKVSSEALAGEGLQQTERGSFAPSTTTVHLTNNADLSTFLHESGHLFLDVLHGIAGDAAAPEGIRNDFDTLLKSSGVAGDTPEARMADWSARDINGKRDVHENFARSFEAYMLEGKAPTPELQGLFSRFRSWLVNIYRNIADLNVSLSPEVRAVMDRLLASEDAIKEAEQARGYLTPKEAPAGMDPTQFEEYQKLGAEATDKAISEMSAASLRDLKWSSNAKSKALKKLQAEARGAREEIKNQVTAEYEAQPVERARTYLKTGKLFDAKGEELPDTRPLGAPEVKIDKGALEAMYPEGQLGRPDLDKLRGLTGKDGMHPDMVAELFGINSGHELVRQLVEAPPKKEAIEALTDQRMMQEHGELVDPVSIERMAESAIHNEARARFMATGLKILSKSPVPARQLAAASKEAAQAAIAAQKIRDLRPSQHSAAEARANKDVIKLAPKDPAAAVQAQRAALLNNRLFRAATDAVTEVQKGVAYLKKFDKDSIRGKIAVDIRDQIDDLLSRFDLRQNPTDAPTRKQVNLENWIESQQAAGYSPSVTADMLDQTFRTPYKDMTVEQFRGLLDTVKAMEHIGRKREELTIQGERMSLDQYVNEKLVPKLEARGENFTRDQLIERPEYRHTNPVALELDRFSSWLRGVAAQLKPTEFKRNQYDLHELLGPFGESIFDPILNANYHKVDMLKGLSQDFQRLAEEQGKDWQKGLADMVDNQHLVDPDKDTTTPQMMRLTRGRMIGIAIHVGNESNFDKLTKGWGWKGEDVWKFLHDNMTEKDWKAVQGIWDLYGKHWPEVEAMNRRLGNSSPEKIEPRPFKTKYGEMPGGYAAIAYDALRSRRGEREAAGAAINPADGLFGRSYFKPDTTTNGSLNSRVEGYTDRVDLDFHHIATRLHETIHDLAYREAAIDANKIIEHPDFRRAFKAAYGPEAYKSLRDWLGRVVNSENFDRQSGALGQFLQYTRTGMVMTAIALRVSTVLKHGGSAGIKTSGYFLGGGEKYLASRMASMGTDYKNQIESAKEKFGEIRARLLQQDRDFRVTSAALFEPESLTSKGERFGHAAVAWSDMMTAVPTAWAAYDRAITEGIPKNQGGTGKPMTEAQAVNYANKIVREAHGSNVETARSMVLNTNSEVLKMFTTLYGFMNTSYGQALDGFDKLRTAGISSPAVLARSFMALIVPAIWAHYLTHGKKKDEDNWAAWIGKAVAGEVAGMVPFVRDAASMVEGYSHAGVVGAESWIQTMVQAAMDVKKVAQGKEVKAPIKDIANALGMGLHIPGLGQLGATAQYAADVHAGKEHPKDVVEAARGLTIGPGH
jgi:hypothetical protein